MPIAIYLAIAAAITLVAVISLRETRGISLHDVDEVDRARLDEETGTITVARTR